MNRLTKLLSTLKETVLTLVKKLKEYLVKLFTKE